MNPYYTTAHNHTLKRMNYYRAIGDAVNFWRMYSLGLTIIEKHLSL